MRLPWRLALMFAVAIGFANAPAAVAQGPIAVGDDCVAWATRHDRSMHMGSGTSPQQAEAYALWDCKHALRPWTCRIVKSYCIQHTPVPITSPTVAPSIPITHQTTTSPIPVTPPKGVASGQPWMGELRQKKFPIWNFGLLAVVTHIFWLWHFSQKTLAQPVKAGLGSGVTVVQAILLYLLGGDGEIGLLEIPIFALPLGLGEFVASFSFKHKSV